MARKGLPAKYARMGFKKGWREYKRTKANRGNPNNKTKAVAKRPKSNTPKRPKSNTPKRPHNPGNPKKKTGGRRRTTGRGMLNRVIKNTQKSLIPVVIGAGGAGITAMGVRALPIRTNTGRAVAQFLMGITAIALATGRQRWLTAMGVGSVFAGGLAAAKNVLPTEMSPMVAGMQRRGPMQRIPHYEPRTTEEMSANFEEPQNPVDLGVNIEQPFMGYGDKFLTAANMI